MASSHPGRAVYYEDLGGPKVSKENPNPKETTSVDGDCSNVESKTTVTTISLKRQRTLEDMFTPSAKKSKVGQSGSGLQTLNSIPFSMSAFIKSLTEEDQFLLSLECECMGRSWLKVLKDEITKPYFLNLKRFLLKQGIRGPKDTLPSCKVYPPAKDIYAWSNCTTLGKVKVVIIGQDPYHGKNQAHGLSFSVGHGITAPPSLVNIYAEIKSEYPEFVIPQHGNLVMWAKSGVLMLNSCLTVQGGSPGSHTGQGWETFTEQVLKVVDKYGGANLPTTGSSGKRGVVFMAWGAFAQKRVAGLDKHKHLILTSAHPSPRTTGFLGNGHFKKANDWLEEKYGPEGTVDWCKLDESKD